jgi:predicted porin
MKKTLIALAAVAATGAAFAQSSVTIDGVVELGVVRPLADNNNTRLDAANGASQIRFRGSEDLGGGLRANFALAQRLSLESGNNDGSTNGRPTFQGESTVGLSGGFGSIRLGRALTAMQGPINATDPWGTLTVGSTAVMTTGYYTDPNGDLNAAGLGRTDGIFYNSPSFGGFSVAATYGFKQSGTNPSSANLANNTKNMMSLYAGYSAGPLTAGVGYEQNRQDDTVTFIHGIYNLGFMRIGAGYSMVEMATTGFSPTGSLARGSEAKTYNLMAIVPMDAFTFKAGYGVAKNDTTNADLTKKLGLGVEYALSKRTTLYTTFGRDSVRATNKTGYDVGIRHTF